MISKKQMRHIYNEIAEISAHMDMKKMYIEMQKGKDIDFVYADQHQPEDTIRLKKLLNYMNILMQWDD